MNPRKQSVSNLLYMLPRIWKVEDRVATADLGLGRFQIDFEEASDIEQVLSMEPFHFDYFMLSIVKWEPIIDAAYPSAITFWVKVIGLPLHFWAHPIFESIGKGLGKLHEVDLDEGRIRVTVDGFKPLVFETELEFDDGLELGLTLRYERLFGFCDRCFSLCHETERCSAFQERPFSATHQEKATKEHGESSAVSYKTAVSHGSENGRVLEGERQRQTRDRHESRDNGRSRDQPRRESTESKRAHRPGKEPARYEGKGQDKSKAVWQEVNKSNSGLMADARRGPRQNCDPENILRSLEGNANNDGKTGKNDLKITLEGKGKARTSTMEIQPKKVVRKALFLTEPAQPIQGHAEDEEKSTTVVETSQQDGMGKDADMYDDLNVRDPEVETRAAMKEATAPEDMLDMASEALQAIPEEEIYQEDDGNLDDDDLLSYDNEEMQDDAEQNEDDAHLFSETEVQSPEKSLVSEMEAQEPEKTLSPGNAKPLTGAKKKGIKGPATQALNLKKRNLLNGNPKKKQNPKGDGIHPGKPSGGTGGTGGTHPPKPIQ